MALQAAAQRPDFYAGVAAFMPYFFLPPPVLPPGSRLSKALFVVLDDIGTAMAKQWAPALGLPRQVVEGFEFGTLPDRVKEGADFDLDQPQPLATRDSTVDLIEMRLPGGEGPAVRVFDVHGSGHFWPSPVADDDPRIIESFGFRNQDFDGADETWRFFNGRARPALQVGDDGQPAVSEHGR
jgi:hypothetical protein